MQSYERKSTRRLLMFALSAFLGSTLCLSAGGCLTVAAQGGYWSGNDLVGSPTGMVYAGPIGDVGLLVNGGPCGPTPATVVVGLVDFPFSLALDTALLPLTIGQTVHRALTETEPGGATQDLPDQPAPTADSSASHEHRVAQSAGRGL